MRRSLAKSSTLLVILVIGVLAIAVTLYLRGRDLDLSSVVSPLLSPQSGQSVVATTPDASGSPSGAANKPIESPTDDADSGAMPVCALELRPAAIPLAQSPASYHFSMPQIVLTRTTAIAIADWTVDSSSVAVALAIPGRSQEELATLEVSTGEIRLFAERRRVGTKPAWSAGALVYGDRLDDGASVIKIARSDGTTSSLSETSADPSVVTRPGGDEIGFLLRSAAPTLRVLTSLGSKDDRTAATYAVPGSGSPSAAQPGRLLAWQPGASHILLAGEGEALLVDAGSGVVCRVPIQNDDADVVGASGAVIDAMWSPDGRYLALLIVRDEIPATGSMVLLIDGMDGSRIEIGAAVASPDGPAFVMDIGWAPDAVTLLFRSTVAQDDGVLRDGLFLVDARSGVATRILPELDFAGGDAGWNLSWSPNGKWLALACPTKDEGRVCLISVTAEQ